MKIHLNKIYFLLIILISCSEDIAEKRIKEFKLFVESVQESKYNFNEKDWEEADRKFKNFTSDAFIKPIIEGRSELKTEHESLKGKYLAYRYISPSVKNIGKMLKIFDSIKTSLENTFDGFKEGIMDIKKTK